MDAAAQSDRGVEIGERIGAVDEYRGRFPEPTLRFERGVAKSPEVSSEKPQNV